MKEFIGTLKHDPRYQAEDALSELTEKIVEAHGRCKGIYLLYHHILKWVADKLIWRK